MYREINKKENKMIKRTYKLGSTALMVAVFGVAAVQAAPITYSFVDGSYFDGGNVLADGQIGGTGTEGGVTITTVDVIGSDGTRLSDGFGHFMSIGGNDELAVNSASTELSAINFDSQEAWEFNFDAGIYLESINLESIAVDTGTSFTISSLTAEFADIVVGGIDDTEISLGTTYVTGGTTLRISYNPGTIDPTQTARIRSLTVNTIPEPATLGLLSACAIGAFTLRRFRM